MKDKLNFRTLKEEDYETICTWWKWWRWPVLPKASLPDNGKCGFMVEKNDEIDKFGNIINKPIVAGFLYLTNSSIVLLEWIVSNPDYKESDRKDAIELLINEAEKFCKGMGVTTMFSIGRNKHLLQTHEKLGWHVGKKLSHEIIKNI
jgi:hypothetical protein|tara:strand:- start:462 stop:902 length:441 start_codon:yes stop_codon:yes gene_type:complete